MCLVLFRGVLHTCMLRSCSIRNILLNNMALFIWENTCVFGISQRGPAEAKVSLLFRDKKRQVLIYIKVVLHFVKNLKKAKRHRI